MILLQRHDTERNMARFYAVEIQPTLFGGVMLVRRWGRIGARGQSLRAWFDSLQDAKSERRKIVSAKHRRGYRLA
jgi:predicted DNA-binding WGR domain protein